MSGGKEFEYYLSRPYTDISLENGALSLEGSIPSSVAVDFANCISVCLLRLPRIDWEKLGIYGDSVIVSPIKFNGEWPDKAGAVMELKAGKKAHRILLWSIESDFGDIANVSDVTKVFILGKRDSEDRYRYINSLDNLMNKCGECNTSLEELQDILIENYPGGIAHVTLR